MNEYDIDIESMLEEHPLDAVLDGYYISNNYYNLVMCDNKGPISNNDIEMIVLAFQNNEEQLYQKKGAADKISQALGRGN